MNHKQRLLYLDESGKADQSHQSRTFILSACSYPEDREYEIREIANRIIFKYWGSVRSYKTKYKINSFVFHSIDIAKKNNQYNILKDNNINNNFWKDFYSQLLCRQDLSFYIVVVNKAKTSNWNKNTILRKSYQLILKRFCDHLIANKEIGKVISESSYDQDLALVSSYNSLHKSSLAIYKNPYLVGKTITSLSLINKHDNAIGSQISDIMSWVGKSEFLIKQKVIRRSDLNKIERVNLELLERKIKSKAPRNKFNLFKIIP